MRKDFELLSVYFSELVGSISEKELISNLRLKEKVCEVLQLISLGREVA